MARNLSRRASDGRRSKWKQQTTRARQTETMRSWFAGTAALAVIEDARPPKTKVYPVLCDGLMSIINVERKGIFTLYHVRIGSQFKKLTERDFFQRWANFYAHFEGATGSKAAKHTLPVAVEQSAGWQPIALLTSGATHAR